MEPENNNPEEPREGGPAEGDNERAEETQAQPEPEQPQEQPRAVDSSADGRYQKNMIIAVAVVVLLIVAGIVGWIISTGGMAGLNPGNAEAVAMVNGEEIPNEKFQDRLDQALEGMEAQGTEVDESQRKQVRQVILNQLINEELAAQYAEENGITVSEEEINNQLQQVTQQLGGQEALEQALSQQGMDPSDLDAVLERELLSQKVAQEVSGGESDTEVTDEQVRQQYDQIQQQSEGEGSVPPFEEIEDQLRAQLEQQAQSGNLSAAFDQLRSEAEIEELI